MTKTAKIGRHLFLWSLFITYEVAFIHLTTGIRSAPHHFILFYALNISLFYFYARFVLDVAFFRTSKPYLVACLLTIPVLVLYLFTKYLIDNLLVSLSNLLHSSITLSRVYVVTNLWRGMYFIGLSIAFWSMSYFLHFKDRSHQMETERLKQEARNFELGKRYMEVENAYLQNQISPHLLFNSLNFIYNDIHLLSERGGRGVMLLSDLLRYSLSTASEGRKVSLATEVEQVNNLIELIRLRYRDEVFVTFRKKGRLKEQQIIPLLLITLTENLVKHGELFDRKHPARVILEVSANKMRFLTVNKKRLNTPYPATGIGLSNLKKRLANSYAGRYGLDVQDENEFFAVELVLYL